MKPERQLIDNKASATSGLLANSRFYQNLAQVYERFSQCEDTPGKITRLLKPLVADNIVLDLGCGTGKYAELLAPSATRYIGLDQSSAALHIARKKTCALSHVELIQSSAATIPLPDASIDLVFSCWVLGTIVDLGIREAAFREARRVCRPNGRLIFVENDSGGEFEALRGRFPDSSKTKQYNRWLEDRGCRVIAKIGTFFAFASREEASAIFAAIWGQPAGAGVRSEKIEQRVVVYALSEMPRA